MADSQDLEDLVKEIKDSIQAVGTTEQAVQKQIQAALAASTTMLSGLIKDNAASSELGAQNLEIHKAVLHQTITAIETLAALAPTVKKPGHG